MKLCRFVMTPLSPWSGRLRSDTLYGLICWHVAESGDEAACGKLINAFAENRPPFQLSSAMPANQLPMPCLPPISRKRFRALALKYGVKGQSENTNMFRLLQKFKKFRKKKWIPLETWKAHNKSLSAETLFISQPGERDAEDIQAGQSSAFEPHVSIDRSTGMAMEGALFFMRLKYFPPDTKLHLYARTDDPDFLLKYLKLIGTLGFGRDSGTGHGQFDIEPDRAFRPDGLEIPDASAEMLLSDCAAPDMASLSGFYRLEVKRGKTGPGRSNPFKKPFLMLTEGSVLLSRPAGPYLLRDLNPDARIAQILEPLALPCSLAPEEASS